MAYAGEFLKRIVIIYLTINITNLAFFIKMHRFRMQDHTNNF